MNKFAELVHNFPKMANMISSTKVSSSLRNEVWSTYIHTSVVHTYFYSYIHTYMQVLSLTCYQVQKFYNSGVYNAIPLNSLFINGKRTDLGNKKLLIFIMCIYRYSMYIVCTYCML